MGAAAGGGYSGQGMSLDDIFSISGDIFGGSGEAYTVGLNYYPTKNVKIVLNWQYNNNDRYANAKGKSYVGYDLKGAPTKDPNKEVAPSGKGGVDYQTPALRFQVAF